MTDNAFNKAWKVSCRVHKNMNFLFFRECWKCKIQSLSPKTFTETKLLIRLKNLHSL